MMPTKTNPIQPKLEYLPQTIPIPAAQPPMTSTNPFMRSGTRTWLFFDNFVVQVLKSNLAPRNVGIANPAFTMNEYYPIHLTPPGQGPPNSPNKYKRRLIDSSSRLSGQRFTRTFRNKPCKRLFNDGYRSKDASNELEIRIEIGQVSLESQFCAQLIWINGKILSCTIFDVQILMPSRCCKNRSQLFLCRESSLVISNH